jgi:Kef-type K+ transport system membrane component KefB
LQKETPMQHLEVPQFLGLLAIVLVSAKLFGSLAKRIGQPAVLGELLAGVILGTSVLGLIDPKNEVFHLLAELGVVILLFEIGLETDLRKLLEVGGTSTVVAVVGVVLPFVLGYLVCRSLGLSNIVAVVAGASLTATSVGITARVFSDLGRLQDPESQIVLGAAVIDDVIGLIILAVVAGLAQGQEITFLGVARITGVAFGFLAVVLLLGSLLMAFLARWVHQKEVPGVSILAVIVAFGLAWAASEAGSAMIIGAFAAGILLGKTPQARDIQHGVTHLGHFFVPLFFVAVGASVDVRSLNPADPANWQVLLAGGLLILVAVVSKFLAGYAPFWFRGQKSVIGAGMIPRGEVGLIFAQMGLSSGVLDEGLFSAVTMMVIVTTFMAPPLLKYLLSPRGPKKERPNLEGSEGLVTEP